MIKTKQDHDIQNTCIEVLQVLPFHQKFEQDNIRQTWNAKDKRNITDILCLYAFMLTIKERTISNCKDRVSP